MKISASAMITNNRGNLLCIKRADVRTWSIPGGMIEAGELPTAGIVRETVEETGLVVEPVELVGLQFWPLRPEATLEFTFRCAWRRGQPTTSAETVAVRFVPVDDLPRPMPAFRRRVVTTAFNHDAPSPFLRRHQFGWTSRLLYFLLVNIFYRFKNWRLRLKGTPYIPPPSWQLNSRLVIQNADQKVLWTRPTATADRPWCLPGAVCRPGEAPWEAAARAVDWPLTGLTLAAVVVAGAQQQMTFIFKTTTDQAQPSLAEQTYFQPGREAAACPAEERHYVATAFTTEPGVRIYANEEFYFP